MPAPTPLVEFTSGILAQALTVRRCWEHPSRGAVAARDLERYYTVLRRELRAARLSEGEAGALCEVLQGALLDAGSAWVLPVEIEDTLPDGLAARWEIDGPALVARLRAMLGSGLLAIVDAVERWWALPDDERTPLPASLRRVGLVPDADAEW